MDRIRENLEQWCSAEGIEFKDREAEETYRKRVRRVADAIMLKVPDRVPVAPSFGMFPALDNGMTVEQVMFDYDKAREAWMKTLRAFEPDLFTGPGYALPGEVGTEEQLMRLFADIDSPDFGLTFDCGHHNLIYNEYPLVERTGMAKRILEQFRDRIWVLHKVETPLYLLTTACGI